MRALKRTALIVGGVLSAAAMVAPATAWACRCKLRPQAAQARYADAIIVAKVNRIDDLERQFRRYEVQVVQSWRRNLPLTMQVMSARTNCMSELVPGQQYLLYLRARGTDFTTGSCAGNIPLAQAGRAIADLRKRYPKSVN